jgi:hypothetical protein
MEEMSSKFREVEEEEAFNNSANEEVSLHFSLIFLDGFSEHPVVTSLF